LDPFTIAAIAGATVAAAQGIGTAVSNNKGQARNRQQLDELMQMEERGELGLGSAEKGRLGQQLNAPLAQAAADGQQRAERIAAAAGDGAAASDLSRLRTESARMRGAGAQEAALQIATMDEAKKQRQLNEIEQRLAVRGATNRDDMNAVAEPMAQIAMGAGQMAGAPPATPEGGSLPGGTTLPATGGPAASPAAQAGAALARKAAEPTPKDSGKVDTAAFDLDEVQTFRTLAEKDPQTFASLFMAKVDARSAAA
jgi:hypothetical protein